MEDKRDKIKPIYSELQGYLSQTIIPEDSMDSINDSSVWTQYNETIDELNRISDNNYDRFKVQSERSQLGPFIRTLTYRIKMGGLIMRIHGEFFPDETPPFSGSPGTVINQSQQQIQFQTQILEIQAKIDEKLSKLGKDSKERKFLERIKTSLASVGNILQLITLLLKTGKSFGLTIGEILSLLQ